MTVIHDTIYPRLKAIVSPQDLERVYTPTPEECALAAQVAQDDVAYLGFLIYLKTFQRLGYFVRLPTVPDCIVQHIALCVDRVGQIPHLPTYDQAGTSRRHQARIRAYRGAKPFREGGRQLIGRAVADAAMHTEQLADLINLAIEELLRHYYELPGFTTLLKVAQKQRASTYSQLYTQVSTALTPESSALLGALFVVDPTLQRSRWDWLKDPTGKPTLTNLKAIADRLAWLVAYRPLMALVDAFPEAKRRHFATEARAYDITTMTDIKPPRRYTLACALLAEHAAQLLDDLTEMFIKRMRAIQHEAKEALQQYHQQHQARTDALVTALRDVVVGYQHEGAVDERFAAIDRVLQGRSDALLHDCDAHLTYAGNNFAPFLWQFYKSHRATIFRLLRLLPLRSASSDTRLEQAIRFLLDHARRSGQWLPVVQKHRVAPRQYTEESLLDLSWIPVGWWRLVSDLPTRTVAPKRINRRHFETCVVSYMLTALTNGDLYIVGADRFGDPLPKLCSWEDYHARIDAYGQQLGIPVTPDAFIDQVQRWFIAIAETTDQAFPSNTQVKIVKGRPVLRRLRRQPDPPGLNDLKRALAEHQQSRSLLDALAYTEHWLNWSNVFGPVSGFETKLKNPVEYYLTAVFCYGCAIGPSATAKALGTLDRRQISRVDQYHISEQHLDDAIQCFVTAYQRCSLPHVWGSPSHASIDGTKWELYEQNLLSEQHIRYGGYGGISLYLLSSTYIALMANLIACSAWEGHYLLDVLEQNQSSIQPTIIHSDTQGQNEAIFGLAFLRGIELMPRIRNWQDLILYRPLPNTTYTHIDAIFSEKVIDWELIRIHVPDLLRIALSIKEGRILPSTILRTISAGSSSLARASRELGRVRRTGFLLRLMTEAELRATIQKETTKSEQFNRFAKWLGFGSAGVIRENDRAAQGKAIKYNLLLANAMIFYNTVMLSKDLRTLIRSGYYVDPSCVAALSPYATKDLERFGKYTINLEQVPEPVDYSTPVVSQPPLVDTERPGMETPSEQREAST